MWQFFQKYTTKCSTTGINNIINEKKINVYPNPFCNKIILKNATGNENYVLLNAIGQLIWTGKNIEQKDFSNLTSGIYLLKINDEIIKLIKQ